MCTYINHKTTFWTWDYFKIINEWLFYIITINKVFITFGVF